MTREPVFKHSWGDHASILENVKTFDPKAQKKLDAFQVLREAMPIV
jgi:hypothetical protein